jgi:hypothetical protein
VSIKAVTLTHAVLNYAESGISAKLVVTASASLEGPCINGSGDSSGSRMCLEMRVQDFQYKESPRGIILPELLKDMTKVRLDLHLLYCCMS